MIMNKELSIEEKATRYDEALKEAVIAHKDEDRHLKATLERIFPELAYSEDERIRKVIADIVKAQPSDSLFNGTKEKCLAWLERQGEQKFLDDIVKEVTKDKDAAISFLKSTGIINENGELADEYKIEQDEQKPAWSEDDEKMLNKILAVVSLYYGYSGNVLDKQSCTSFLKSLKDRYTWKPSDEQMNALWSATEKYLESDDENVRKLRGEVLESLYEDLKKLKE